MYRLFFPAGRGKKVDTPSGFPAISIGNQTDVNIKQTSRTRIARRSPSKELPTLPIIATKLLALTAQEETTLTDIANLIAQDMGLSTKVLRVANSSFYSFPQQISSINQAVSILGINAVRSLVLSFSFLSMGKSQKNSLFDFTQFWEHSLVQAAATKLILEQVANADAEEAFTCGLLQNIGQLALATTLPQEYNQVLQRIIDSKTSKDAESNIEGKRIGV